MWDSATIQMIANGVLESLYMTLASTLAAYIVGLPLGVILVITEKDSILPHPFLNKVLNVVVNILRSVPFIILMFLVIPITRFVAGTSIGSTAAIVPLFIAAAPFIARIVETSIKEVDQGIIEAALSMGASPWNIILKVMLPETKPSLILNAAIATTTILGYSAMAGVMAGGGLGDIATRYGWYRYDPSILWTTVVLLVLIVQVLQGIGTKTAGLQDKRKP